MCETPERTPLTPGEFSRYHGSGSEQRILLVAPNSPKVLLVMIELIVRELGEGLAPFLESNTVALLGEIKTSLSGQALCLACGLPIFFLALLSEIPPDELFARCATATSDPAPWREFFRRYRGEMRNTVVRITSGRYAYLYDDAMQDCYKRLIEKDCRALKAYNGGQDEGKAQAYLRKIAASAAYRAIEGEKPDRTAPPPPPDSVPSRALQAHPQDSILRIALEQCLHMILHGRNKFRNMLIFKLVVLDGFKPDEIVLMLGHRISSAHVVEMVVSRTRPKLRRCLSR